MNGWRKELFLAKTGVPSARWVHNDGRIVHIHSRIDPLQEADRIVRQLSLVEQQLVYSWYGVGLGYAAERFLQTLPDYCLLTLFDPDPSAREFLEQHRPESPLLSDHHVEWKCYPPTLDKPFYTSPELLALGLIDQSAKKTVSTSNSIRSGLSSTQPVVLYLKSGYHLEFELLAALRAEGVRVVEISYWHRNSFVQRLLEAVHTTHPAFVLAINHLGFDEEGALTKLLEELHLPVASWFVDSPSYILQNHRGNQSDLVTTFLWEEEYAKRLAEWFPNSVWLPLAGDERRLRAPLTHPEYGGVFVGDSQYDAANKWRKRLPDDRQFDEWIEAGTRWLLENRLPIWNWNGLPRLSDEGIRLELESAIVIEASRQYRWQFNQAFADNEPLQIFGDEGWNFAPGKFARNPSVNYFSELPDTYRNAAYILNLTSFQMPTAVNQRVFDVPLCGGILLTDRQSDLDRLFEPGLFYTFSNREEAIDLAHWLSSHPTVAEANRTRQVTTILAKHTYRHRVRSILQVMLERYSSRTFAFPPGVATILEQ